MSSTGGEKDWEGQRFHLRRGCTRRTVVRDFISISHARASPRAFLPVRPGRLRVSGGRRLTSAQFDPIRILIIAISARYIKHSLDTRWAKNDQLVSKLSSSLVESECGRCSSSEMDSAKDTSVGVVDRSIAGVFSQGGKDN